MVTFECLNCRARFEDDEPEKCPRCSSGRLRRASVQEPPKVAVPFTEKKSHVRSSMVYGDTKDAWKSFHNQEVKTCLECGGAEFDMNWKKKERVCRKCGAVSRLARRSA
ncbi:MAG: hypothetical protein V1881_01330 [Candidatus Micrarchaeota archaeon]